MSGSNYQLENFLDVEKKSIFQESPGLQQAYWAANILELLFGAVAIMGLIWTPSWRFIVIFPTVAVGLYFNHRLRTVTNHRDELIWSLIIAATIISGFLLTNWAMSSQ